MFSFVFGDLSPLPRDAVCASARTGDLILYASSPAPIAVPSNASQTRLKKKKKESPRPDALHIDIRETRTIVAPFSFGALFTMLPAAIWSADGVRESSVNLDRVAVVIESRGQTEADVLIYNSENVLTLLPLSALLDRPACLRPLMTEQIGNDKVSQTRRQLIHRLLTEAVRDLTMGRAPPTTIERTKSSSAFLATYLLFFSNIITQSPSKFCDTDDANIDDISYLFGADTLYVDNVLVRDYAYGNQIWML
jgi:hypothetical protein